MSNQSLAQRLTTALSLDLPPIGLAFIDTPPDGVPTPEHPVTSACAFWRLAEKGVFYAPAAAHDNCPVGAMVMGFPLSEPVQQQLGELMTSMCDCSYLDAAEGEKIPGVPQSAAGILYGPVADLPDTPDLLLVWLTPRQAMLYNEAAGTASWTTGSILSTGRPACAALPAALASDNPTISWGCIGMRTFTEIPDDRLLAAIPGTRIAAFLDDLERTIDSNATMHSFYESKKAALAAAN